MNALIDFKKIEKISHALADPNRIAIMEAIRTNTNWLDIFKIIKLSQPATSHHLKILKAASLIRPEKTGRKITYSINKDVLSSFAHYINAYTR